MMRIAFWGLGSIAKRHIKNLNRVLKKRGLEYQIDVFRHSLKPIEDQEINSIISNVFIMQELTDKTYDVIFITNPTSLHYDAINICMSHTVHMFIEKPVFDSCDIPIKPLELKTDAIYYVACPMRYMNVFQYIKKHIDFSQVYSARAICSSYLPDWRPGMDYRDTYSAHKALGGGVAIDLIHEWDYLTALMGMPNEVFYLGGKYSGLEIDSDDLAVYIGKYDNKVVELHLDYFGRKTIRELMLFTKDDIVVADFANNKVIYEKENRKVDLEENRDSYQIKELDHFLDMVEGKADNDNSIENALQVLKITQNDMEKKV